MGDPEGGPQPSGLLHDKASDYAASFAESRSIADERWKKAEQRTTELIRQIQGTQSSEEHRKDVADYVGDLIHKCFDCQVYTFGSVPLKTYLPHGDIDLTIISREPSRKDTWANDVRSMLERKERDKVGKFLVKDVQYINAEVKLIKCHVGDIFVDISFNQLGGLCTLCFLEEVDRVIGKDHFFKRSIILVKAWCYYESTILGAHHGFISTYALETLVLYIFHVFHAYLRGPLEVLLRFLEFFSKFDWQRYAVSVWGPVPLASLPEMIAEPPRKDGGELLLSKAFLDVCLEEYAVFLVGQDSQGRAFTPKYLNVVDPLRAGNNLGRSVNQTNFKRIVKVLGHSADKLLSILRDPNKVIDEYLEDKVTGFFRRTKQRLNEFEKKRPDTASGVSQSASGLSVSGNHQNRQNGQVMRNAKETTHPVRSNGAETYFVDHNLQIKAEGSTLELESKTQGSGNEAQKGGRQGHIYSVSATSSGTDTTFNGRVYHESVFNNDVSSVAASNGNSSSASESSYAAVQTGVKSISNNEANERSMGHRVNMDVLSGVTENGGKVSRQFLGDSRDSVKNATQRSEQKDSEFSIEELSMRVPAVTSRSNYTQTNFENYGGLSGSSESPSSVSSLMSATFATEGLTEEHMPSTRSSGEENKGEGSHPSSLVVEQASHVDANGGLDGQLYVPQKVNDPLSRGFPSPPSYVMPHGQIPVTLPHSVQWSMHLPTSMTVSSTRGHLPSNHTGTGPRAGPPYPIQLQRGPPAPPFPPGHFHGYPSPHQLLGGEIPNPGTRLSSYPVQQGEDKGFEHQQRIVWQQMKQMQVRDHLHTYSYIGPVSSSSAAVSPPPQYLNSGNYSVISSAPALVTSGPHHIPSSLSVPKVQPAQNPSGNSRTSHAGNISSGESLPSIAVGQESLEVVQVEENDKSEAAVRGSKASQVLGEKKISIKSKSGGNDDAVDVGLEEGVPFSSAESSALGSAQSVDATVLMVQVYPQLLPSTAPAMSPVLYPHPLSSSIASHGNGLVGSEFSPYPPAPKLPPPRNPPAHSALPSPTVNQSSCSSAGNPNSLSTSPRPPVVELVNGSNGFSTMQRQRPTESTDLPSVVHYPTGSPFPYISMYSPAYPIYKLPHSPDPAYISLDLMNGIHLSSIDNYNDTSFAQVEDLHLRYIQQGRPGVGERLRAAGIATSSLSRSEATSDSRISDVVDMRYSSGDVLSSDFRNHLGNLRYAQYCQHALLPVPMYVQPPFLTPSAKDFADYRPWEGLGRSLAPNMNVGNVRSHGHGLGPASMNTSARVAGNFPRNFTGQVSYAGDELPKSHGGTGPFLPNPRPPYVRERQSSGSSRNQHGGYGHDQSHGPRFRGSGRGQSKYEHRSHNSSAGFERNHFDSKGGDKGRDRDKDRDREVHRQSEGFRRNPVQSAPAVTVTVPPVLPVAVVDPGTSGVPAETYGKSSVPGTARGTVSPVVVPTEKRVGAATESMEFGSLGPVEVGASQGGSEGDHGASHVSAQRTHEQVNSKGQLGFAGLSLASGDRSSQGPASPSQRVMQMAYQLKEEDFPPLSFRGQPGSSTSGLSSSSTAGTQSSPQPACVPMPSW